MVVASANELACHRRMIRSICRWVVFPRVSWYDLRTDTGLMPTTTLTTLIQGMTVFADVVLP